MMGAPEQFAKLVKEGKFAEMVSRLPEVSAAAQSVFPDMFPKGGKLEFQAKQDHSSTPVVQEMTNFFSDIAKGNFKQALNSIEGKVVTREQKTAVDTKPEIQWVDKQIALADLNNPVVLQEMNVFMKAQGKARSDEMDRYNPNNVEKRIKVADPIIGLPDGKQFRLRESGQIYENGNWRRTSAEEKSLIESVQKTPAGQAMLGKTGMILLEEWAHTQQQGSGGLSHLTEDFRNSDHFKNMKEEIYKRFPDPMQREVEINEALREIDFAAAMRESGISTEALIKLLGDQHLKGVREHFYRYLDQRPPTQNRPAEVLPKNSPPDSPTPPSVPGDAPSPTRNSRAVPPKGGAQVKEAIALLPTELSEPMLKFLGDTESKKGQERLKKMEYILALPDEVRRSSGLDQMFKQNLISGEEAITLLNAGVAVAKEQIKTRAEKETEKEGSANAQVQRAAREQELVEEFKDGRPPNPDSKSVEDFLGLPLVKERLQEDEGIYRELALKLLKTHAITGGALEALEGNRPIGMKAGGESLVLLMEKPIGDKGHRILKLTFTEWQPEYGRRPFDAPCKILGGGALGEAATGKVLFHTQDLYSTDISAKQVQDFTKMLTDKGFYWVDNQIPHQRQLGLDAQGKLFLLDYGAVERIR